MTPREQEQFLDTVKQLMYKTELTKAEARELAFTIQDINTGGEQ